MYRQITFTVLLIGAMTCGLWADANVRIEPVDPRRALCVTPRVLDDFQRSSVGKLSKTAEVATMNVDGGEVHVAIDYLGTNEPKTIVVDFTGTGEFTNVTTAKIVPQSRGKSFLGQIKPVKIKVKRGDQKYSVGMMGSVYRSGNSRSIDVYIGAMLSTKCTFGKREVKLSVIDGNHNLGFGDRTEVAGRDIKIGDTLVMRGTGGSNTKMLFGQPVKVDDTWYEVEINDNHELTATPIDVEVGQVQTGHRDWSAIFVGEKYACGLAGGAQPVDIPADNYRLARYEERMGKALISCQGLAQRTYTVEPGQVTRVEIGSPIQGIPVLTQRGDTVTIRAQLRDAAGLPVSELRLPNGRRPPPPRVAIFNQRGKKLYTATLEYG